MVSITSCRVFHDDIGLFGDERCQKRETVIVIVVEN